MERTFHDRERRQSLNIPSTTGLSFADDNTSPNGQKNSSLIKSLLRRKGSKKDLSQGATSPALLKSPSLTNMTRKLRRSSIGNPTPLSLSGSYIAEQLEKEKEQESPIDLANLSPDGEIRLIPKDMKKDISKFQLEDYAKKYFQTRKKGIFKKQVPIQEMLTFQKKPLTAPLLQMPKNQTLIKQALTIFETILMYQDIEIPTKKKAAKTSNEKIRLALQIVSEGIREGQLRDEIYCQLCKQTCDAPEREFTIRGWELLVFCCVSFPPTKNFEGWLFKYIEDHAKSEDDVISKSASFCLKKLQAICQATPSQRIPTLGELEKIKMAPFSASASPFGSTLEGLMELQRATYPDLSIPRVAVLLCNAIIETGGEIAQGIFRVKGETKVVNELRAELDIGNYDITFANPHIPASLLKLWARELKEPIIPYNLYSECLQVGEDSRACVEIFSKLPDVNRRLMVYVLQVLQRISSADHVEQTKMSPEALAAVLSPSLVRSPSNDLQEMLANSPAEQLFVRSLITHINIADFMY